MATKRIIPVQPEQPGPKQVTIQAEPVLGPDQEKHARRLGRAIRIVSAAQVIIATAIILAICYVGKTILVTLMVSVLLAFILAPVVNWLERIRLPRWLGALFAILLLLAITYSVTYFFYNRALQFIE